MCCVCNRSLQPTNRLSLAPPLSLYLSLNDSLDPMKWKVRDVAGWLGTIGLGEFASEFTTSSVDGDMLFELTRYVLT